MYYSQILSLITALLFYSSAVIAQNSGGSPPSVKWSQINTPAARVIFPAGLDSTASRVANIISFIQKPSQTTIGNRSRKINIVLQNQTAVSNGYVGLAPFRSEFFLTPPQNSFALGSLPWPDMLGLHEYRHAEQYSNFDVGISRALKVLFGDGGQALANAAAIPDWFFEGDAVFQESNLSQQGRGKLPSFFNGYKSLWEDGRNYTWMQLRNGSLKNYIPNHYELGYMLVAYGREKYGDEFWKNVTQDAAAYKSLVYPFQKAIKKHAGISYKTFRKDALTFFKDEFNVEDSLTASLNKTEEYYNEQYPTFNEEGAIVFLKSSFTELPAFTIRQKDRSDKKIRTSDFAIDPYFSYKNGRIIYVNYRPELRWGNRDYNEIKILDLNSGKQRTMARKSRSFSPDISRDGKLVVAVAEDDLNRQFLRIFDGESGKLRKQLSNHEGLIYTYPKFTDRNSIVATVRNKKGEMSVGEFDVDNDEADFLLPFTFHVIGFPVVYKDTLYFTYSYLKNDELFAYTFSDKTIWKIETPEVKGIGKYAPSVNENNISWHYFTSAGNRIISIPRSTLSFSEISGNELGRDSEDFAISSLNKTNAHLLNKVPDHAMAVTKYRKAFRLFNFHSIIPDISDPNYTLSLVGENILNTFQSELSLTYNQAEGSKRVGFSGIYSALFPYLSGGVNYTFDRRLYRNGTPVYFNQLDPYAGLAIPLNLSRGRSATFLNVGSRYVFNKSFFRGVFKDSLAGRQYRYLNNYFSFNHQIQKASGQIFPSFAQAINGNYKTALGNYTGNQAMVSASIYLPGLFKNNSLVLTGAWLNKDSLHEINFSSGFPFSRGYEATNFYRMYKWGANYHLPLLHPDAGFGNILFVLRVRANVFYDDTFIKDFKQNREMFTESFRSAGTEVSFDTKWWNQIKVSFGFRYSYLMDQDVFGRSGRHRWEIILPVNILNQ